MFRLIVALALLLSSASAQSCTGTATYRLRIITSWTRAEFGPLPFGAHFSPVVAFAHSGRFSSFVLRGYATPGVQMVAETGATFVLQQELSAAGDMVGDVKVGPAPDAVDTVNLRLKVDCSTNYFSFITMVAPSPDWFIATANRALTNSNGQFINVLSGDLLVYDAGTDSGPMLTSPNQPTNPRENIAPLNQPPFAGNAIGRFTMRRLDN